MPLSDGTKIPSTGKHTVKPRARRFRARWVILVIAVNLALIAWQTTLLWDIRQWMTQSYQRSFQRGFVECEFQDANGERCRYVVFVPYSWKPGQKLPLMLYLNGRGKNGDDGLAPLIDGIAPAIWERRGSFPYFVVWPQCPENDSWAASSNATRRALAIMTQTADCFETDADRCFLSGLSSGGSGVWAIAAAHPDRFAAIVPISSSVVSDADVQKIAETGIPVWTFSVADDGVHVVKSNRTIHRRLIELGRSPRHTELETDNKGRMDSHDAWSFAYRNAALHHWLMKQNRSNREARYSPVFREDDDYGGGLSTFHCELRSMGEVAGLNVSLPLKGNGSFQRVQITVSMDRMRRGGISAATERQNLQDSWLPAECSFLKGTWNDLRVHSGPEGVSAELNGWPLFENVTLPATVTHSTATSGSAAIGPVSGEVHFEAIGAETATVEIRNLRGLRDEATQNAVGRGLPQAGASVVRCSGSPAKPVNSSEQLLPKLRKAWDSRARRQNACTCSWEPSIVGLHAQSAFQADRSTSVLNSGRNSTVNLTADEFHYRGPWTHQRADLLRVTGLSGDATYTEFLKILQTHFQEAQAAVSTTIQLDIRGSSNGREDRLILKNGSGHRAVLFPPGDPATTTGFRNGAYRGPRIGCLDDLYWLAPVIAVRPDALLYWSEELDTFGIDERGATQIRIEQDSSIAGKTIRTHVCADSFSDFLPVRVGFEQDRVTRELIDLHYDRIRDDGAVLNGWDCVAFPAAATSVSDRYFPGNDQLFRFVTVRNAQWQNSPAFDGQDRFIPCPVVQDLRTQEWYHQKADGTRHVLSSDEITQVVLGDDSRLPRSWFHVSLLVAVAMLGVAIRFRKRRLSQIQSRN